MACYDETLDPNIPATSNRPVHPRPLRPGAAPPPARHNGGARDDLAHPKQFGQYRILPNKILGQGGMGVVYTAEQAHPKRLVALKVIRPMLGTREMVKRFRQEAEVLGRLEHPGIARIYDAGTADAGAGPQPFFAMELVRGRPLLTHTASHKVILRDKLELLARICDAVHYAHEHGVVHRDLKPSNILVEPSGQPKILDFGVARVTDSDVQSVTMQTDSGSLVGTVQYMSPEQATGNVREMDARSDVYALGLIAYEVVTGQYPFDLQGKPLCEALRIVREQDVPSLDTAVDRRLRGDVATIIAKAVEKDRARRYASAAEMAADIRRHLAHRPIAARRASVGYVLAKSVRRNRSLIGSAVAALLVVVLGTAWLISGQREAALREVHDLMRQFDRELATVDWSPESVNDLTSVVARLSELSPGDGVSAGARLNTAMANHLDRAIRQVDAGAGDTQQIQRQLALLAARDATAAAGLRQALRARAASNQRDFSHRPNGSEVAATAKAPNQPAPATPKPQPAAPALAPAPAPAQATAALAQAAPAQAAAAPAVPAIDEELRKINGKAWLLRREGKIPEAAELRRTVLEKAKSTYPAGDERVIAVTVDYVELLLELQRYDEADGLLRTAAKDAAGHAAAAEHVSKAMSRVQRQRGTLAGAASASPATASPATQPLAQAAAKPAAKPATQPLVQAVAAANPPVVQHVVQRIEQRISQPRGQSAPAESSRQASEPVRNKQAPPAPPAKSPPQSPQPLRAADLDLSFVDKAIVLNRYADAEMRLMEMYLHALDNPGDAKRDRAILLAAARVYEAWGKPELAQIYSDRAGYTRSSPSRSRSNAVQPSQIEWLDAMNRFAYSMRLVERFELSKAVRERVLTEGKLLLPPTDARLITFQINYVELLIQMKEFEGAEKELLAAEAALADEPTGPQATKVRRSLARLYGQWNKPERAKAYQVHAGSAAATQPAAAAG